LNRVAHTATHCNTLQNTTTHTAKYCNTIHHTSLKEYHDVADTDQNRDFELSNTFRQAIINNLQKIFTPALPTSALSVSLSLSFSLSLSLSLSLPSAPLARPAVYTERLPLSSTLSLHPPPLPLSLGPHSIKSAYWVPIGTASRCLSSHQRLPFRHGVYRMTPTSSRFTSRCLKCYIRF